LERLLIPVLEESLVGLRRVKVGFLHGLIKALDRVAEAGIGAWLIAPTQQLLGLDWVAPNLVQGTRDRAASPVFVDGKVRQLRPLDWWAEPSVIQKRIRVFREVVSAVNGHPALRGWVILDRALEWVRPGLQAAHFVLRSFLGEIRDRDENATIYMGVGWSELLEPGLVQSLAGQVDGFRLSGLETWPPGLEGPTDAAGELWMASYLGTLSGWLFGAPTEIEVGWGLLGGAYDPERIMEAGQVLARQGVDGLTWLSLVDPESRLWDEPPWVLRPGLQEVGLLDQGLEPKAWVESWVQAACAVEPEESPRDFIDLSQEAYMEAPQTHLSRLWNHFLESRGLL
jgi:hypothetical protein